MGSKARVLRRAVGLNFGFSVSGIQVMSCCATLERFVGVQDDYRGSNGWLKMITLLRGGRSLFLFRHAECKDWIMDWEWEVPDVIAPFASTYQ